MDRRSLRENAFKLLFEAEFKNDENRDTLYEDFLLENECEDDEYLKKVFFGASENKEKLDEEIQKNARGWKLSRISKVCIIIMRISIYEMLYAKDVPFAVSINEAVELAKKYDDEKAPRFINGILNSVAQSNGLKEKK